VKTYCHGGLLTLTLLLGALMGCAPRESTPAAQPAAPPAAIRYESHLAAGGILPPGATLHDPHAGDAAVARSGAQLFTAMNCDGCHGGDATGGVGPNLGDGRWRYGGSDAEIFSSIFYGRPKGMPAFGGVIGVDGAWILVSYLKSLPKPDVVSTQSWIEPPGAESHLTKNSATAVAAQTNRGNTGSKPAGRTSDLETLMRQDGCAACHADNKKMVGPAFRDIAAKYRGQKGAEQKLVASARNGGVGVWGTTPMPPNSAVNDDELHLIVKQLLLLK
jgi:cytochrome c551/c552